MKQYAQVYGTIIIFGAALYTFSLGITVIYCALSGRCSTCGIV